MSSTNNDNSNRPESISINSDNTENINDDESLFVGPINVDSDDEGLGIIERLKSSLQQEVEPKNDKQDLESIVANVSKDSNNCFGFEKRSVTFSVFLPFQQRIIRELLHNNGLLIMAQGLGYLTIASNLLHALCMSGYYPSPNSSGISDKNQRSNIVIVLGFQDEEKDFVYDELRKLSIIDSLEADTHVRSNLHVLNSDLDKTKRGKGGFGSTGKKAGEVNE